MAKESSEGGDLLVGCLFLALVVPVSVFLLVVSVHVIWFFAPWVTYRLAAAHATGRDWVRLHGRDGLVLGWLVQLLTVFCVCVLLVASTTTAAEPGGWTFLAVVAWWPLFLVAMLVAVVAGTVKGLRRRPEVAREAQVARREEAERRSGQLLQEERLVEERRARDEARRAEVRQVRKGEERARQWALTASRPERVARGDALLLEVDRVATGRVLAVDAGAVAAGLGRDEGEIAFLGHDLAVRGLLTVVPRFSAAVAADAGVVPLFDGGVGIASLTLTTRGLAHMDRDNIRNRIDIHGNVVGSNVVAGEDNQTVIGDANQVRLSDDEAAEHLRQLVELVRERSATAALSDEERRETEEDLLDLENQLRRRPLRRDVVRQLIRSSRALAEGLAGNAAFAALVGWLAS